MTDDDDLLAAEIALGLLDEADAAAAQKRLADNPALQARVDWWQERFTPLAVDTESLPSQNMWTRIDQALPQNDNTRALMRRWRAAAITAMSVSAALGAALVLRPLPVAPQSQVMVAALTGTAGASATIGYEAHSGKLTVAPGSFVTGGRDAELWIIPADGTPRSLGVIKVQHTSGLLVAANRRAFIQPGMSFAISLEPKGGSPTGVPTGPVIGAGKISGV